MPTPTTCEPASKPSESKGRNALDLLAPCTGGCKACANSRGGRGSVSSEELAEVMIPALLAVSIAGARLKHMLSAQGKRFIKGVCAAPTYAEFAIEDLESARENLDRGMRCLTGSAYYGKGVPTVTSTIVTSGRAALKLNRKKREEVVGEEQTSQRTGKGTGKKKGVPGEWVPQKDAPQMEQRKEEKAL